MLCRALDESAYYLVRTIEPHVDRGAQGRPEARRTRIKRLSIRGGLLYTLGSHRPRELREDLAAMLAPPAPAQPATAWFYKEAGNLTDVAPVPTARQLEILTCLAGVFGMSIPAFWEAYDGGKLPGQYPDEEEATCEVLAKTFAFVCTNPRMRRRLKWAARQRRVTVEDYVANQLAESLRCDKEDAIWHPKTGKIVWDDARDLANLRRRGPLVLPA